MFNLNFRHREYGLVAFAAGAGIFLGIVLPPWGWMIGCGAGLIVVGVYWIKKC